MLGACPNIKKKQKRPNQGQNKIGMPLQSTQNGGKKHDEKHNEFRVVILTL